MLDEKSVSEIRNLIRRYLKREYDVYDDATIILGVTYEDYLPEDNWKIQPWFDQIHSGEARAIPYCDRYPDIEKNGPYFLRGTGTTIEKAIRDLKRRVNKLLRVK